MKKHSTGAGISRATRFLREGGAFACLAALMLAVLAPSASAQRMVSGVTAQLDAADIEVREGEHAIFRFKLSRPLDFKVRYAYRTEDSTAKAGKDYKAKQGYVVFPAGQPIAQVRIKTLNDDIIDNDHFKLVLSDMETYGYGKVWGRYVWTDWWRVEGLPDTKIVNARIQNAPGSNLKWRVIPSE